MNKETVAHGEPLWLHSRGLLPAQTWCVIKVSLRIEDAWRRAQYNPMDSDGVILEVAADGACLTSFASQFIYFHSTIQSGHQRP
jgi:hypothetical protein